MYLVTLQIKDPPPMSLVTLRLVSGAARMSITIEWYSQSQVIRWKNTPTRTRRWNTSIHHHQSVNSRTLTWRTRRSRITNGSSFLDNELYFFSFLFKYRRIVLVLINLLYDDWLMVRIRIRVVLGRVSGLISRLILDLLLFDQNYVS